MELFEKLMNIQSELKAPKTQRNDFGKYNYRSCEDILEAVKPLLLKYKATMTITDDIVMVGDRIYVKATATICDIENGRSVSNTAFAREEETKKGSDGSQITGASSSYARKYALNGLFLIDDTKDSDATNESVREKKTEPKKEVVKQEVKKITDEQKKEINSLFDDKLMATMLDYAKTKYKVNSLDELSEDQAKGIIEHRKKTLEQEKKNESDSANK